MLTPTIPVSWGELIDKITILEIKRARLTRPEQLDNIDRELALLSDLEAPLAGDAALAALRAELAAVNLALWDIEDAIRRKEADQAFDAEFVALARAVYRRNDHRAAIKRQINIALASELIEEKSYAADAGSARRGDCPTSSP